MRDNLARQIAYASQEVATIVGISGPTIRVRSSLGEVEARRAASCLLEPALGDEVLVVHHEKGSHVLAVLERNGEETPRISAEGDLEIAAPGGKVIVSGGEGVSVITPGEAEIAANRTRVTSQHAELVIDALSYVGDRVTAQVDRIKTVAQSVESIAGRWVQRLDRAYRFIARSESVRAEYLDFEARSAFHVKSKTTLVNSEGLTKLDGSQIHLG